ncbi:DNA polymerase iv [Zalerion maritima]|uniref:DNA-directed DNA polymerase n=1 Tax=Zalerion maritima TaxID=339359 RepID=A0AAD5WT91_9PEZI|nr:DNA polymerase iv [Zalerion maritima]
MSSPTFTANTIDFDEKVNLFRRLDALDDASDEDDDLEKGLWERERKRKAKCRAFTRRVDCAPYQSAPRTPGTVPTSSKNTTTGSKAVIDLTSDEADPVVILRTASPSPRRNQTAPGVIENTPLSALSKRHPDILHRTASERAAATAAAADDSFMVIKETPIRVPDTPARESTVHTSIIIDSSSVSAAASASSNMAKKRKRGSSAETLKLAPKAERIFDTFSFFYIPNDDIHPARRIRIAKAKEYGVRWVRKVEEATHVVVDKNLVWKDIAGMLGHDGQDGGGTDVVVVTEDYPVDCIRYKTTLNPRQKLYEVKGSPERAAAPSTVGEKQKEVVNEKGLGKIVSREDLQLKHPPRNQRSRLRDEPSQATTPSSTQEPSSHPARALPPSRARNPTYPSLQRHCTVPGRPAALPTGAGERTMSSPVRSPSSPSFPSPTRRLASGKGTGKGPEDELSSYISMMQQYKDLPLDHYSSSDDDAKSTITQDDPLDSSEHELSEGERELKRQKVIKLTKNKSSSTSSMAQNSNLAARFEDRFSCSRGGTKESKSSTSNNPNHNTIEILQKMLDYYTRTSDHWRTYAYRRAISTLRQQSIPILTSSQALSLPNIGVRLADKIQEIATTSRLQKLDYVTNQSSTDPVDRATQLFLGIYGVGLPTAQGWTSLGFRTLTDLLQNPEKARLTPNQKLGIERYSDLNTRIPRREVSALANWVVGVGKRVDPSVKIIVGGSYRRGAKSSGDVDFIVTKEGTREGDGKLVMFLEELLARLEGEGGMGCALASLRGNVDGKRGTNKQRWKGSNSGTDGSKWHGCLVLPEHIANTISPPPEQSAVATPSDGRTSRGYNPVFRRVDFLLVPSAQLGAALLYFTGNDIFNRSMRLLASKKGMRLNQRGLYKGALRGPGPGRENIAEGEPVEGRDERRIFEVLGVGWREPEDRWC